MGEVHKKITLKDGNKYVQNSVLGIAWCCLDYKDWKQKKKFDFFEVKGEVNNIFDLLGLDVSYKEDENIVDIILNKKTIGFIASADAIDSKLLKGGSDIFFAQIYMDDIKNLYANNRNKISY